MKPRYRYDYDGHIWLLVGRWTKQPNPWYLYPAVGVRRLSLFKSCLNLWPSLFEFGYYSARTPKGSKTHD